LKIFLRQALNWKSEVFVRLKVAVIEDLGVALNFSTTLVPGSGMGL
jgi:hypothetical protein